MIIATPTVGFAEWMGDFSAFGGRALPRTPQARLSLGQMGSSFSDLTSVRVDDPLYRTQNGTVASGPQALPHVNSTLWSASLAYPVKRATFGVAMSGPFGDLRRFRASTPYDFVALRDATPDTQFKAAVLGSVAIIPSTLFVRAGAQFFISSSGTAEAVLIGNNPTARFAADVGLNSAALVGASYETASDEMGLAFRQEVAPKITQGFSGQIAIGNLQSFEQPIWFRSVLYFEPHKLEAYWRHHFSALSVRAGLTWEVWSRYQPAFLTAETKDAAGKPLFTEVPTLAMGNTLNPEIGVSSDTLLPFSTSLSYRYSPTPILDFSGPTNFLDSNLHRVRLELGTSLKAIGIDGIRAELLGEYGWWAKQQVQKARPEYIGAPGYTIQGDRYRLETRFIVAL